MALIGLLVAIAIPSLSSFKPNVSAAATEQLLGAVGRARQLAISEHTTVYMVFVPPEFRSDSAYTPSVWQNEERAKANALMDKQLVSYNFVSLRSLGDQPAADCAVSLCLENAAGRDLHPAAEIPSL